MRGEAGDQVARLLKTTAPTWYLRFPQMGESTEILAKEVKSASHERMWREFGFLFGGLSRTRPVILLLDDLHWADASTCDLLSYLGAHLVNVRILF